MTSARTQSTSRPAPALARFMTVSLAREMGILLSLSVMFPFMVHVLPVPGDARLGARLLPMFYAPLLAALWGRPISAWVLAFGAPWLNWLLTGHPSTNGAAVLSLELVGFVAVLRWLLARMRPRWFLAVPAFATGKLLATLAAALLPALIRGRPPGAWAIDTAIAAWPGVAILVGITVLALHCYPSEGGGHGPAAA